MVGGKTYQIEGRGVVEFVTLNAKIKVLDNVLFVLNFSKNLILVGELFDCGIMFMFHKLECLLIRRPNKVVA